MMVLATEAKKSNVFGTGKYGVTSKVWETTSSLAPPKPMLILSPTLEGSYNVLMFLPGFYLQNIFYSQLLTLISSHGYIVVAPQLYATNGLPPSGTEEVESVARVANWLPAHLQSALPPGILADLDSLSLSGHSRGGKAAFALALGYGAPMTLPLASLIAIDPVAGLTRAFRTSPDILTYKPHSLHVPAPVTVIGTGLGPDKQNFLTPPCAAEGVNYEEFFRELRPPCYLFVAKDYGHMNVLDDKLEGLIGWLAGCSCKNGSGRKGLMRSGVSGIVVETLKASLEGEIEDLDGIVAKPEIAPIVLDPVQFVSV